MVTKPFAVLTVGEIAMTIWFGGVKRVFFKASPLWLQSSECGKFISWSLSGMSNTKQPNLSDLAIDHAGTRKIRSQLNKTKRIKITINIDERSLTFLRKIARRSALPYLRLLDQALKEKGIEKGEKKPVSIGSKKN